MVFLKGFELQHLLWPGHRVAGADGDRRRSKTGDETAFEGAAVSIRVSCCEPYLCFAAQSELEVARGLAAAEQTAMQTL